MKRLKDEPEKEHVAEFHSFILPILYGRNLESSDDYSKWLEPIEGFMALHNLQEDGNFKPPNLVTPLFAHLHYHIRGAMLFEGDRTVKDFGNNIYKLGNISFLKLRNIYSPLHMSEPLSIRSRRILIPLFSLPSMPLMSINDSLQLWLTALRLPPTLVLTTME